MNEMKAKKENRLCVLILVRTMSCDYYRLRSFFSKLVNRGLLVSVLSFEN